MNINGITIGLAVGVSERLRVWQLEVSERFVRSFVCAFVRSFARSFAPSLVADGSGAVGRAWFCMNV